jgi:hypothetical protein
MAEIARPEDEFLYIQCANPLPCPEEIPVLPRNHLPQPQPGYGPVLDVRCPRCGYRFLVHVRNLREYQGSDRPYPESKR